MLCFKAESVEGLTRIICILAMVDLCHYSPLLFNHHPEGFEGLIQSDYSLISVAQRLGF